MCKSSTHVIAGLQYTPEVPDTVLEGVLSEEYVAWEVSEPLIFLLKLRKSPSHRVTESFVALPINGLMLSAAVPWELRSPVSAGVYKSAMFCDAVTHRALYNQHISTTRPLPDR